MRLALLLLPLAGCSLIFEEQQDAGMGGGDAHDAAVVADAPDGGNCAAHIDCSVGIDGSWNPFATSGSVSHEGGQCVFASTGTNGYATVSKEVVFSPPAHFALELGELALGTATFRFSFETYELRLTATSIAAYASNTLETTRQYNAVNDAWLRLGVTASGIVWETSPDGQDWTGFSDPVLAAPLTEGTLRLVLSGGQGRSEFSQLLGPCE